MASFMNSDGWKAGSGPRSSQRFAPMCVEPWTMTATSSSREKP